MTCIQYISPELFTLPWRNKLRLLKHGMSRVRINRPRSMTLMRLKGDSNGGELGMSCRMGRNHPTFTFKGAAVLVHSVLNYELGRSFWLF